MHVSERFKSREDGIRHQLENLFERSAPNAYEAAMGPNPDKAQINPIWFDRPTVADRLRSAYDAAPTGSNAHVYPGRFHG